MSEKDLAKAPPSTIDECTKTPTPGPNIATKSPATSLLVNTPWKYLGILMLLLRNAENIFDFSWGVFLWALWETSVLFLGVPFLIHIEPTPPDWEYGSSIGRWLYKRGFRERTWETCVKFGLLYGIGFTPAWLWMPDSVRQHRAKPTEKWQRIGSWVMLLLIACGLAAVIIPDYLSQRRKRKVQLKLEEGDVSEKKETGRR